MADSKRELLSPAEVAARLSLSRPHIYTLAAAGKIRSIKFGRAVRFDPRDVERFIREHRRERNTSRKRRSEHGEGTERHPFIDRANGST